MSNNSKKRGSSDPLQEILAKCGQLTKDEIKQLLSYLPQLLADWEDEEQRISEDKPSPGSSTSSGRQRGSYIEWKYIKRNNKQYGPYPYWRYRDKGVYKSIYMKGLSQSAKSGG